MVGHEVRPEHREAEQARVVVHDVELVALLEKRQQVLELPVALADALARCDVERRDEPRVRGRIARRKEGDVGTRLDEPIGK